ncbi:MAG: sugar phosphate nucleotidyltransferase [Candidatus Bathycorpusculaceae bacterium]
MKALILAGGFATRLRPISCTRPKSLLPVINKPLLQWMFERLVKNNVKEAVLAVNHQTEVYIRRHKIPKYGVQVKYSRDPWKKPLGTGGAIKNAEALIGHDSPFMVLNGDIFADVNYMEIIKIHEEKNAIATIALCRVEDPSRYGVAELTGNNRIKRFIEKPPREEAPTNLINAGVYIFSPEIFNYVPKGKTVSMEREIFPKLAEKGSFYGYVHEGLWMDIGKPEEYLQLNRTLLDLLPNKQFGRKKALFEVKNPVAFGREVSVGEKSVIGPYVVLGQNAIIGKNVRIYNSIVFPSAMIGDSTSISGAIIGENVLIGKGATVRNGCIIGDHAKIRENVSLAQNVSVCPAKEISESVLTSKCVC